ncbi:hypothetical protein [Luteipulveratus mongoliensis]|uniref:DUF1232 domain-containing protein n=1 Tax=Luteipulveratus mongoliensis TaxID=571913 RepID=A0A0K1JJZ5_9MICO|nr:hypothetical protein [Luteipulveratus mongoliensis]AKU17049.1 hypothetical protein VV02_16220 [Luteipulveratus mongoliensis]
MTDADHGPDPGLGNLLMSRSFVEARIVADQVADAPELLRELLDKVDHKRFGIGRAQDLPDYAEVDIARSVLVDRIDHLEQAETPDLLAAMSPTLSSHLRLVLAALEYFVVEQDVIPDPRSTGHLDDMTIVRWVVRLAREQLLPDHPADAPAHEAFRRTAPRPAPDED